MAAIAVPEWELSVLLDRRELVGGRDTDLVSTLTDVLDKMGRLVPSEGGAILLDDPATKVMAFDRSAVDRSNAELVFVAAFGPEAARFPGARIASGDGLVGRAYGERRAYFNAEPLEESVFGESLDSHLRLRPRSVLALPLTIRDHPIGVVVLLDARERAYFDKSDRLVLEVLCDYMTALLQSFLDARKAKLMARIDHLTGLWNNWYFNQELDRAGEIARRERKEVGFIFFDLDNFKQINDQYGHQVGSQTLQVIGNLIRSVVEEKGKIARFGGDEFEIFLPGMDEARSYQLALQLQEAIAERRRLDPMDAREILAGLTASFGVATLLADAEGQVQRMVYLADQAMYRAKAAGKNTICLARI